METQEHTNQQNPTFPVDRTFDQQRQVDERQVPQRNQQTFPDSVGAKTEPNNPVVMTHKQIEEQPTEIDTVKGTNEKDGVVMIKEVNSDFLEDTNTLHYEFNRPFDDLEIGNAFFVPNKDGQTTENHLAQLHQQIAAYRDMNSEIEKDEDGDDILETVVIASKKRNSDGTLVLEANGNPLVGANPVTRPKRIYYKNFIARAVVKGNKVDGDNEIDHDGVLVVRVA